MNPALAELCAVSARLGADPLQVQGPGGNSSIKLDGVMWVKASGTRLSDAMTQPIMLPVDAARLKAALLAGDPAAGDPARFALAGGAAGLRPSIETAMHAALDWPVVLHTHCVATIATAVRRDAARIVADRLGDLGAVFLPYVRPGADLARAMAAAVTPRTRVIVLGNHGLVVTGDSPAGAEALLRAVAARLDRPLPPLPEPDPDFAAALAGCGMRPVPGRAAHAVARMAGLLALAEGGALYPDHVVFLGPGVTIARPGETLAEAARRARGGNPPRPLLIVPGRGAALPADAAPAAAEMACAFGEVLLRAGPGAALVRLDPAEEAALLGWDAEKHRQALEARRAGRE